MALPQPPVLAPMVSIFGGVDLASLDGLVLLATLIVAVAVRRQIRAADPTTSKQPTAPSGLRTRFQRRERRPRLFGEVIGLALMAGGGLLLARPSTSMWLALGIIGVGAALYLRRSLPGSLPAIDDTPPGEPGFLLRLPLALRVALPAALAILVFAMNVIRPVNERRDDIVLLWLASMLIAIVFALPRRLTAADATRPTRSNRRLLDIAAAVAIVLVALGLRTWQLDTYPWRVFQDDGAFAMEAMAVIRGDIVNPFRVGWLSHPTLYFFILAAMLKTFGESVADLRLLSSIIGTLSVAATFLYGRRIGGRMVGYSAAILMATLNFSVFWGRSGLNNAADMLFTPLALWLVDRGVYGRHRIEALLGGLTIGISQYFYQGTRLLVPIAGIMIIHGFVMVWRTRGREAEAIRAYLARAALVPAGTLLAFSPFAAFAATSWDEYQGRVNDVSIFNGYLDRALAQSGQSAWEYLGARFFQALTVMVHGYAEAHFRVPPPLVGWALVVPVVVGFAIAIASSLDRRYNALAVALALSAAGIMLTEGGSFQSNRFVIMAPLACLAAGIGLDAIWRVGGRLIRSNLVSGVLVIAVVAYAAWWHVDFTFSSPYQLDVYSDPNTEVATYFAYDIAPYGDQVNVYLLGAPRMGYGGMPQIQFMAPDTPVFDIDQPLDPDATPDSIAPGFRIDRTTIFVVLPNRIDDLATLQRWFPGGTVREVASEHFGYLYTEYRVEPAAGGDA